MMNTQTNETCRKCNQELLTGDLVIMDWAGHAAEHINCAEPVEVLAQAA